jgi:TusA-related sulfurtransferase
MSEKHLNCRGLQCPGPIVKLFQACKECAAGDVMIIEATDHGFVRDVAAWCDKTGNKLLSVDEKDGVITAKVEKG